MPEIHEHHEKAAHHHEQAAKHHREAAKHHKSGAHEKKRLTIQKWPMATMRTLQNITSTLPNSTSRNTAVEFYLTRQGFIENPGLHPMLSGFLPAYPIFDRKISYAAVTLAQDINN
jgi:hypothetical protein